MNQERVLPHLARRFGDLTYRHAAAQQAATVRARRIVKGFERAEADDEIAGTYHGLPVSIVETRLKSGAGDDTRVAFDGLLIELTLPRNLTGTTVVVSVFPPISVRMIDASTTQERVELGIRLQRFYRRSERHGYNPATPRRCARRRVCRLPANDSDTTATGRRAQRVPA